MSDPSDRIADVTRQVARAVTGGLQDAAEDILRRSNQRVPIDPSRELERSGKVSTDGQRAAVSYGTPYAVAQHERTDYRHDPGRTAKFLENAADHRAILAAVADSIRRQLR